MYLKMYLFLKPSYLYVRWIYCSNQRYTSTVGLNTSTVGLNNSMLGLNTLLHNALPRLPLPSPTGRSSLARNCPGSADSCLLSSHFPVILFIPLSLTLSLNPRGSLSLSSSLLRSLLPTFCLFMAFALSVKFSIRY